MAEKAKKEEAVKEEQAVKATTPKKVLMTVDKVGQIVRGELQTEVIGNMLIKGAKDDWSDTSKVGTVTISFGETESLNGVFEKGKAFFLSIEEA